MTSPSNQPAEKLQQQHSLRASLREAVAQPHAELEKLPLMQSYASGACSLEQYLTVTHRLQQFWCSYRPNICVLSDGYSRFLKSYLRALELDVGERTTVKQAHPKNEIAFFYVLLGSGLGAKIILKNNFNKNFPKRNLLYLAEQSKQLWGQFNSQYLIRIEKDKEAEVIHDSSYLFTELLKHMKNTK